LAIGIAMPVGLVSFIICLVPGPKTEGLRIGCRHDLIDEPAAICAAGGRCPDPLSRHAGVGIWCTVAQGCIPRLS
jgi:hypothetical protein